MFLKRPKPTKNSKNESALKRKTEQDSGGMSSKNQRVDDSEEVPMDSDEVTGTCDLIVLGNIFGNFMEHKMSCINSTRLVNVSCCSRKAWVVEL